MTLRKAPRENSNAEVNKMGKWSSWRKAIRLTKSSDYEKRNGPGFKRKDPAIPNGDKCGIYELKTVKRKAVKRNEPRSIVVYVGISSRKDGNPLRERIMEHCNGSHLEDKINAKLKSYDLWYRTMAESRGRSAEDLENELLDAFEYQWNEVNN